MLTVLGSLSALSALESAAAARRAEEVRATSQTYNLRSQTEKIKQLKLKRDELLQKLHNSSTDSRGRNGDTNDDDSDNQDPVLASALAYLSELKEKLNVYRLTGVSVVKTDSDSKVLCFATSYKGVFYETYHLELRRLDSGRFKVIHHDLPPFIVFSAMPADLEVKDVRSAVRPLQEALSMFVLRREELKGAQAKFSDTLHIAESSAALDYLCFHLDVAANTQVEITLKYTDLNNYLPSSVKVIPLKQGGDKLKEGLPEDVLDNLHTVFCGNRLCLAIPSAVEILVAYFSPLQQTDEN